MNLLLKKIKSGKKKKKRSIDIEDGRQRTVGKSKSFPLATLKSPLQNDSIGESQYLARNFSV